MSKKWHWFLPIFTFLILVTGVVRINLSDSLPSTMYFAIPLSPPYAKAQIVRFEHPELKMMLGKVIIGMPGERISIIDQTIFINEIEIGLIQTTSESGRNYHPISEGTIPEGHYFVSSPHPQSFDSRYAEFGLVKEEWIRGVLWPIF